MKIKMRMKMSMKRMKMKRMKMKRMKMKMIKIKELKDSDVTMKDAKIHINIKKNFHNILKVISQVN